MSRASSRRSSQNGAVTSRRGDKKATARKLVAGEREVIKKAPRIVGASANARNFEKHGC